MPHLLFVRVEQVRVEHEGAEHIRPLALYRECPKSSMRWVGEMTRPDSRGRYAVIETVDFAEDWSRGVAEGWINPMADSVTLRVIKEALERAPWGPSAADGWADNIRAVSFPMSARNPFGRVRIRYEVVEDDREVRLLAVNLIG